MGRTEAPIVAENVFIELEASRESELAHSAGKIL